MSKLNLIAAKIFPSNAEKGEIGSLKLNVWLANIFGIPIIGLKEESFGLKIFIFLYGVSVTTLITFIYIGFEIYDLVMNWNDLESMAENIGMSLMHLTGVVKALNLLYRLEDIKGIFEKFKHLTRTYVKSDKQFEIFYSGELDNKIVLCIYISIVASAGSLGMTMMFMNPGEIAGKIFPYRAILPTWLPRQWHELYAGICTLIIGMQIVTVDYLNINIMKQLKVQLKILNLSFNELIVDTTPNPKQEKALIIYKQDPDVRLNSIIEHHCLLRSIRQDTEDIFCQLVLLQFLSSLMTFAMSGFQATVTAGGCAIMVYGYCGCIFCQLFMYCLFGDEVSEQSKTLATSGYNSTWYHFDRHYGKSLLVFLTNAQRPFLFTAGGFMTLSLPSFAGILSKSLSYIAVLRQLYAR